MIDHALFDPATIDPETLRLNAEIVAAHAALPDPWSLPIEEVRARRRAGTKAAPAMPHSARAEWLTIEGPAGPLKLRVIRRRPRRSCAAPISHSPGRLGLGRRRRAGSVARAHRRCLRLRRAVGGVPARPRTSLPRRPARLRGRGPVARRAGPGRVRDPCADDRRRIGRRPPRRDGGCCACATCMTSRARSAAPTSMPGSTTSA